MPLTTTHAGLVELDDAKISQITVDTASTLTYATAIDIPASVSIDMTDRMRSAELEGDAMIMDAHSRLMAVEFTAIFRALPLDALAVLLGGAVTASGTTPNMIQTYSVDNNDEPSFFKLQGRVTRPRGINGQDATGARVVLWKCRVTRARFRLGPEYTEMECSGIGIGTIKDTKIRDIVFEETKTALS